MNLNFAEKVFAIALVSLAISRPLSSGAPLVTHELKWGEAVDGLQMAVWPEANTGFVHCWIRNAWTNDISYNRYFLGDWGFLGIQVRETNQWVPLPRTKSESRSYHGFGPSRRNSESLSSLQVVTNGVKCIWADRRFSGWIPSTNAGTIGGRREFLKDLPFPADLGATLGVDLGDFQWPRQLLRNNLIEIRIVQQLAGPPHKFTISICSPACSLEGPIIQNFFERLARGEN